MGKLKTVWLPRVITVYVWQGLLVPDYKADDRLIDLSRNNAGERERNNEPIKADALLFKEIEENNKWARLGAQLYFGWFALMSTVNGLAANWLFTSRRDIPPFADLMFLIFVALNLMGIIVTFYIRKHMLDCDRRIQDVLTGLTRYHVPKGDSSAPQSPVPRHIVNVVFAFTGITLFMLLIFWIALWLWPEIFLA